VTNLKMSVLALSLLTASVNAAAEDASDHSGFTISPMLGYYNFDSDRNVKDEYLYSIGLGYQFNSPWAVELVYLGSRTERSRGGDFDIDLDQIRLDGLYNFNRNGNFQPYLAAGIGESEYTRRSADAVETNINFGGGAKYFLSPKLSMRGDVRMISSLDEEQLDMAVSVGLHFAFGGSSAGSKAVPVAATAAVIADTDGDGVPDSTDQCPDSDAGAKVDAIGCYIMIQEGHSIELNVNFANNSSEVTAENYAEVTKLAEFMTEYPQTSVVIEGHTDDRGAADYNQGLSERRADAVAAILVERDGVSSARVSTKGFGESSPLVESTVADYRAMNRRVVAVATVTVEKKMQK
jgi:OOP family OmpA-OmpF porin